ncbi:cytochrome b N-terminal domain-containing protein [Blastopirellula marina]|uniref:Menaquinol-cytochrome-c reductase cytochrome b subunit n=1 Tax=Blastopirellula marina DSM 3645 TaxID=314230 RepID=A3ZQU1_9BACT|nr:cytochrome b N-terminal domain-containing protein [Blastopirellula marina]EAQ81031.1 menaquinol-cytochrome-c reductase cytochrome b subunit [Blastopirellula marina DSM 3645]
MNRLWEWLDDRTGYKHLVNEALYEHIPGGSRWRYVWGSTLVFAFVVQMITGTFLWMAYSANSKGAWESVYYIQYEMQGGWILRGLHHFMAQAMIVLLALHFLQVVIDGAYKAPREFNFWTGLILMKIVLGLSLTGYLLPWDQKGYWATKVATTLMGLIPAIGGDLQKVVVGGTDYGHATLTRFFALHAGVLPGLLLVFLGIHLYFFRRAGIHAVGADKRAAAYFWPDQVLKDAVACLAVLAVVMLFVVKGFMFPPQQHVPGVPVEAYFGAELGAPADPANSYAAARPEWYFLFLFQFLKLKTFAGHNEIYGAIIIPGLVMGLLFLMPFIGRWKLGHRFNVALVLGILLGAGSLTFMALREDWSDAGYKAAVADAHVQSLRAVQLAQQGIPDGGAISLMRNDPKTQGPILFARHCGSCHAHQPVEGLLAADPLFAATKPPEPASAPNLYKFGTTEWMTAFLDPHTQMLATADGEAEVAPINSLTFFGGTAHVEGEMAGYVTDTIGDEAEWTPDQIEAVVMALANESGVESPDQLDADQIAAGRVLLQDGNRCAMCHKFHTENDAAYAPDLTGYASRKWLLEFISNPAAEKFYGDNNDRMPSFYIDPHQPLANRIQKRELELIVDWIAADWYEPEAVLESQ